MDEEVKRSLDTMYGYSSDEENKRNWLKAFLDYVKEEKARDMQKMKVVV
jgi:hypothetical protein